MPKGHHLQLPFSIKNWKTNKILTFSSQTGCAKRLGLTSQIVCDLKNGRRKFYGEFCMPQTPPPEIPVFKLKNLRTGEILCFSTTKEAAKATGLGVRTIKKLINDPSRHFRHFASADFMGSVPMIIDKKTGIRIPFFGVFKNDPASRKFYYLAKAKRISANSRYVVEGQKDYKYKIIDTQTGKESRVLTLRDFAAKNKLTENQIYHHNPQFQIVEG
jgi:hypothetical protein